jgi:cytochrome c5
MAKLHIWLTFVLGTVNSIFWLIQGLEGAPRRFAVLPHNYDGLTRAAVPVAIALGAAQLLFFWNVVQTVRGKVVTPKPLREALPVAVAEAVLVMAVLGLCVVAGATGWIVGHYTASSNVKTVTVGSQQTPTTSGTVAEGKEIFDSSSCGGCHTLAAAGTSGAVGPNLDQAKPPRSLVVDRVTNGKGTMPSFKGRLTPAEIQAVADFVAASTR